MLSTVYFRPGGNPQSVLRISIIVDMISEKDEEFTLELTSFDVPVVLVNSVLHVVVKDNDNGMAPSVVLAIDKRVSCIVRFSVKGILN